MRLREVEREAEIDLTGVAGGDCIVDFGLGRKVGDVSLVREQNLDDLPGDVEVLASRRVDQMVVSRKGEWIRAVDRRLARIERSVCSGMEQILEQPDEKGLDLVVLPGIKASGFAEVNLFPPSPAA